MPTSLEQWSQLASIAAFLLSLPFAVARLVVIWRDWSQSAFAGRLFDFLKRLITICPELLAGIPFLLIAFDAHLIAALISILLFSLHGIRFTFRKKAIERYEVFFLVPACMALSFSIVTFTLDRMGVLTQHVYGAQEQSQ
ncbi:hypothetical protein [Bordetella genomosp. 2]|uniref:hypothetical protein n=1 Tax=Bordetella genomosp. 2 TaxID=1983456 RepID=UPI00113FEF24|nr:hypothetical protein [Bordetella genomosp. 2]